MELPSLASRTPDDDGEELTVRDLRVKRRARIDLVRRLMAMSNDGVFLIVLAVIALVGGLWMTLAPSPEWKPPTLPAAQVVRGDRSPLVSPRRPRSIARRLAGVVLVLFALGGGLLIAAGAALGQIASH